MSENLQNHTVSTVPMMEANTDGGGKMDTKMFELNANPQCTHGQTSNNQEQGMDGLSGDNHESASVVPVGSFKRELEKRFKVGQKVCLVTHSIPKYDVAEGILISMDPFKKVNGEVLGTEFWKVLVEKAIIPKACLEIPQKGARTIGEVVGRSVAWRACNVMFDED